MYREKKNILPLEILFYYTRSATSAGEIGTQRKMEGMPPDDFLGRELARVLERLAPRLEDLFRSQGIGPEKAAPLLDHAVLEVQLRCKDPSEVEQRLLRAVARGCEAEVAKRQRAAAAALAADTDAEADPEG